VWTSDVRLFKEQKGLPVAYVVPASGTPVVTDASPFFAELQTRKKLAVFMSLSPRPKTWCTRPRSITGIPCAPNLDRGQLPAWMNERSLACRLIGTCCEKKVGEWLRYWDTEIRGRNAK